jgi:hypothetical protein
MVCDIGCVLRWRTDAELDDPEPVLLVQLTGGMVFLMRVKLQPGRMQRLRKENESRPPALSPLGGVDEHPIDVGTHHRQKGDNLVVVRTDPDVATGRITSLKISPARPSVSACRVGRNPYAARPERCHTPMTAASS